MIKADCFLDTYGVQPFHLFLLKYMKGGTFVLQQVGSEQGTGARVSKLTS